jgi:D-methionine transport system ATP-binding protein
VKDVFSFPRTKIAREFLSTLKPMEEMAVLDGDSISQRASQSRSTHVYRLHFLGESTKKPILSELIRKCMIDVNILSGTIRSVGDVPIGELVVEMQGSCAALEFAKNWLAEHNVKVEAIDA